MHNYTITVIPGDGIGPELTAATRTVLDSVQKKFDLNLTLEDADAGDTCLRQRGIALPNKTIQKIRSSAACLKGPVGETAADVIVKLRLMFDLYANIRPLKTYLPSPPTKSDIDMIIVRENTEDVYKGLEFSLGDTALCLRVITRKASERIARKAFALALKRNRQRKVTAIHKANVMKLTCGLFATVCREIAAEHPQVMFEEQYVDAAAMRLIRSPQDFDVIVTTNMFGDILSDEAAQLVGGLGMAPGANIGDTYAIFEPVHGSAPDIAGKNVANPCSMILAAKLMFEYLGEKYNETSFLAAANGIEWSIMKTLKKGVVVPELGGRSSTFEMAKAIAETIKKNILTF